MAQAPSLGVEPVIRIKDLRKVFRSLDGTEVLALDDVSMEVFREQLICVVGPSGCGKTTLLKIISGLTPPSAGQVTVNGVPVKRPPKGIGIVFQTPVLFPWRTVIQNVLYPVEILKLDVKRHGDNALALLSLAGLSDFRDKYPRELSGGMQQRVALCRALIHEPSLLLMDEPFGALDAMTREEMNVELLRIWSEKRKTVFFITHSISEAVFLGDYVVVMTPRPGRIDTIFKIDLPRPRALEMRDSALFGEYQSEVRRRIYKRETPAFD